MQKCGICIRGGVQDSVLKGRFISSLSSSPFLSLPSAGASQIPSADIPGSTMQGISLAELTNMQPQEQKQVLGERLYMSVMTIDPLFHDTDLAGKITGMLLEMDNGDILHLLESPDALREKVQEAIAVLEAHKHKETTSLSAAAMAGTA